MLAGSMARDDDGRRKPKGTLALDITDMDLEGGDPPPKASRSRSAGGGGGGGRSGKSRDKGRSFGRAADDEPPRRPGGGGGGGGGGGKAAGTLALDISQMDLDDEPVGRSTSRPGGSGQKWGVDDEPRGRSSRGSRGSGGGGRQVEQWEDDPDRYDDPRSDAPGRPTRPASAISDEDLARATADARAGGGGGAAGDDATRAIGQFELPNEPPRPSARLTVQAGEAGQPIHTLDKDVIQVGREVDNDVVLLDSKASRYHFELRRRGSSFELRDLESGNGTHVNGHKVSRVTLTEGAVIRVGATELVFDLVAKSIEGPKGGISSAATEAAEAPPAPDAPPAADAAAEAAAGGADHGDAEDSGFPLPMGLMVGLGAVGLLGFVFVVLLLIFVVTGDDAGSGTSNAGGSSAGDFDEGDGDLSDDLPPDVLVGPALSRADKAFGAGDWFTARAHLVVVQSVAPGNKRAKEFLGRVDRALQTQDTPALRVMFEPPRPKRGKPLAIRVRVEQPMQEVRATFMGERLILRPSPNVPREYVAEMKLPKKVKKGEKELDVELTDMQDAHFEFARRVVVR